MEPENDQRNVSTEELEKARGSGLSVSSGAKLAVAETYMSRAVAEPGFSA